MAPGRAQPWASSRPVRGAGDGPGPFLGWSRGLDPMIPGTGTRWHSRPVAMALAAPAGCRSPAASSCTKLGLSSARGCAAHTKRCWLGSGRSREASLQHAGRRPGLPASFPRLENPQAFASARSSSSSGASRTHPSRLLFPRGFCDGFSLRVSPPSPSTLQRHVCLPALQKMP